MIFVHMRPAFWTSQGTLSCSPWKSVCYDWTATDATQICMPGCESILAVTASWLISVCGFCLCDIRRWKSPVWWLLRMKELLNLLQRCWVRRTGPIPWPGRSCDFTLLDIFWSSVTEPFIFRHKAFSWWKDTLKLNVFWDLLCSWIIHSIKW